MGDDKGDGLDRALARLAAGITPGRGRSEDWCAGYISALDDVRRSAGGEAGARVFTASGAGFPPFGVVAASKREAAESLAAFAQMALTKDRVGPLYLVADPLEPVKRLEVVPRGEDPIASTASAAFKAKPAVSPDVETPTLERRDNGQERSARPQSRRVILELTLAPRPEEEMTDANRRFLKPQIDIISWDPREADPGTDELLNLSVVIRDAVDNGDLDDGFEEVRLIMGIGGLPPGVSDAPGDDGGIGNRRGLRVVSVNPDLASEGAGSEDK